MELTQAEKINFYKLFNSYLKKYGHMYPEDALQYIHNTFGKDLHLDKRPDIMNQIYAAIEILPDDQNTYKEYWHLIKNQYNISCNILEVGGGFFPALAKYIDEEQKTIGHGTITVYDPRLVTNKLGNIKLIKQEFTALTDISNYNLIIGIMPCESTEIIVSKATSAEIPFFIALCGCTHFPSKYFEYLFQPSIEKWYDYIYTLAKKKINNKQILFTQYLDSKYSYSNFIINSKKTK